MMKTVAFALVLLCCVIISTDATARRLSTQLRNRVQTRVRASPASDAFLTAIKGGAVCYDSYQATPAKNNKDWKLFSNIMKPVFQQMQDNSVNIASWRDYYSFDFLKSTWKEGQKKLGDDAEAFLDFVSKATKPTKNTPHMIDDLNTYFIQFNSKVTGKECTEGKKMRVSFSIDETLNDKDRWTELGRIMTAVVVSGGNNRYLTSFLWGKIETPEMMRVDPLLLQFCYSDWNSAKAILDELNDKLSHMQPPFKTSTKVYPAFQARVGSLSVADYSKGTSFGTDLCTAFDTLKGKNGGNADTAATKLKSQWEAKFGPIENYGNKVIDATEFVPT